MQLFFKVKFDIDCTFQLEKLTPSVCIMLQLVIVLSMLLCGLVQHNEPYYDASELTMVHCTMVHYGVCVGEVAQDLQSC